VSLKDQKFLNTFFQLCFLETPNFTTSWSSSFVPLKNQNFSTHSSTFFVPENQNFSTCSSTFMPSAVNIAKAASKNQALFTTLFKLQNTPTSSGNFHNLNSQSEQLSCSHYIKWQAFVRHSQRGVCIMYP